MTTRHTAPLCALLVLCGPPAGRAVAAKPSPARSSSLQAPAGDRYAKHDPNGTTILPNGRFLRPAGKHFPVSRWPHGLVASADGKTLFVASEGMGQLVTGWEGDSPQITPLDPGGPNSGGAALSPDGRTLYWSSGETGGVYVFDLAAKKKVATIPLNAEAGGRAYEDSFAIDLKLSADGRILYCADVTNFRVAVIDTQEKKMVGSVSVGRYPYALAEAGNRVYVANIGMFEYSAIPKPTTGDYDPKGTTFPPFGFPSREASEGVTYEGRRIPGLGSPNAPESFSVWGIDVSDPRRPRTVEKVKAGLLVDAPSDQGRTVGGSGPNYLVATGNSVYVSDGNNDLVERIDRGGKKIAQRIPIRPSPLVEKLRGVGPSGMALSPDGSRLYVAESGINAVGVIDAKSGAVIGHLPTAWYPYRVAVSPDGKRLAVISFKGFGNGPNAGKSVPNSPFLGMKGVLTLLDVPSDAALKGMTRRVLENNGMADRRAATKAASPILPSLPGKPSDQIKYVVFITKENHTFDTIFDRVPGSENDPSLLRWGLHQKIASPGQPTLEDAGVMVNHNALARQFTLSDNFYLEPEASGVGHRWLVGVQPNTFCQMTYTLGWDFKLNSTAPGRRASFGSNGSIAPEDYPEAGALWEHLARHRVPFRNYGEGFEFAGVEEGENEGRTGAREVVNIPMSKALYDNTSRDFPIFNMNIPDQYRADWFIEDFNARFMKGKGTMPPFLNLTLCNDHGTDPRPAKGYPYLASWMADNDLALGRVVEFLSHTPYWKHMAIFVAEDDAGGEADHIDAQRSVMLIISPWAKRRFVSHRHTTILSMHRTLYEILGLPPLNMFDALASDFSDAFTDRPDFTPYTHVPADPRVFDPEKAKDPSDPDYRRARQTRSVVMDDPAEMERVLHRSEGETTPDPD